MASLSSNAPLVSICIPTKNRADVLDQCLNAIFTAKCYAPDLVEVVVSDNASTDNTQQVVEKYLATEKNLIYNRNIENLGVGGELNFIKVLSLAHGKMLRLLNDYSVLSDEGITVMLDCARTYGKEPLLPLLFVNDRKKTVGYVSPSISDLLIDVRENLSWISIHAYWKEQWDALPDKTREIDSKYMQIDWLLRLAENDGRVIVYRGPFISTLSSNTPKGGYNWFEVQLTGLLRFFLPYVYNGRISRGAYSKFKRILYKSRISAYKQHCFLKADNYSFDHGNILKVFYDNYSDCWWFYLHFPLYVGKLYVKQWTGYWWLQRRLKRGGVKE